MSPGSFGKEGRIFTYHLISPLLFRAGDIRRFEDAVQKGDFPIVNQAGLDICLDTFGILELVQKGFDVDEGRRSDQVTEGHDPSIRLPEGKYVARKGRVNIQLMDTSSESPFCTTWSPPG